MELSPYNWPMQFSSLIQQARQSPIAEKEQFLVSLARLLDSQGLHQSNAVDFLALLSTGNSRIADVLFSQRTPATSLATIAVQPDLIRHALEILITGSAASLDKRIIMACLGYISLQVNFEHSISDVQHLAKYLVAPDPVVTAMVVELLERIGQAGPPLSGATRRESAALLDHFQDHSKKLSDRLPANLLG